MKKGIPVEYMITSAEDALRKYSHEEIDCAKILDCLTLLDGHDRYFIIELFYHTVYTVKKDDTQSEIAAKYNTTVAYLQKLNKIK